MANWFTGRWITLKCPTCGAKLRFEKDTDLFTCEHCGNVHILEPGGVAYPAQFKRSSREWMRIGDYNIFLHDVIDEVVDGKRHFYINVEYANPRSVNQLSCRSNQWLLFDDQNYSYETVYGYKSIYEDKGRPHLGGERFVNPNMAVRGWLAFSVPLNARLTRLQFFTGFLATRSVDILLDTL